MYVSIRKKGQTKQREEERNENEESSQSLVLFLGLTGTGMTSPAAYQSASAFFRF